MIKSFRHKGIEKLYKTGSKAGILAEHEKRLRLIVAHLNLATEPKEMGLPGLQLHALTGKLRGFWSVSVSGNWRVIFRFQDQDAYDVDYLDYH